MTIQTGIVQAVTDLPAFRPISRSRSARESAVASAKRRMAKVQRLIALQGSGERAKDLPLVQQARRGTLQELLWIRAEVEQALWLETGGRMGERYATPNTTLRTLPIRGASFTDDTND